MEHIPDIEEFHSREERIVIPKLNDIDVDDMTIATPRINVTKEEYKVLLHDENLIKKMNSLFDNLEIDDGKVVVKEKQNFFKKYILRTLVRIPFPKRLNG